MRRTALAALACSATVFLAMNAPAPSQDARRFDATLTKQVRYGYLVSLPGNYDADPAAKHPVIVFLHGSGETGEDVAKLKTQGLTKLAERRAEMPALAPFIILSPPTPTRPWDPEALAAFREAMLGKPGRPPAESDDNVIGLERSPVGNSRAYSISRVQRECDPDTVAAVMACR